MTESPARESALAPVRPSTKRRARWSTHFVDVSNNNGPVDYRAVAHDARTTGITGVAMKATEGTTFTDSLFAGARAEAEHFGLRVCAYHYARPDEHPGVEGATREATHFARIVGKIEPGEWRPMLDFETAPFDEAWARQWCKSVRAMLGVAPLVYSYVSALEGMKLREPIGAGLVIAYPNGLPQSSPCPSPWHHWTAHQYSWHGHVRGVSGGVDLDWTPAVWTMLAYPVRGAALEPVYAKRRRSA